MNAAPTVAIIGGPDVHFRLELMGQLKDSFGLSAFGSNPELTERFNNAGFQYHTYHLSRRANLADDLRGVADMVALLRQLRPQIVHTYATKPGVWGRLAARIARVPIIIGTLPGLGALYANETLSTRLIRGIYQPLQKMACHLSDVTVFQNQDDFVQFTRAGVAPKERSTIIAGSGVPTDKFDPKKISAEAVVALRKELSIRPDELVVTLVSRVNRSKGVFEFAQAAEMVRQRHPYVRFVLVGPVDGTVDALNTQEIRELQRHVLWTGARSDIPVVLAMSNIFVLPSAYREGVPRVLLEAAAMELPIVTTNSPGCNDVVREGVNGFLTPLRDAQAVADALLKLIENPELRQRFGKAARQRVLQHFALSVVVQQTRNLYNRQLIEKGLLFGSEETRQRIGPRELEGTLTINN